MIEKDEKNICQRCSCCVTHSTGRIVFDGDLFCRDCGLDEIDECGMDDFHNN